ncbi:MAG: hypothetical protein A3J28_04885 [Acidobacteria bacterium RIFCSPLOWO2_12_FULL_60_22]|nr:MAG: hypothetical protein A3J28_04885 [Acidobacteria bacterium RIFCSPLOWO2_12_FULL_60_22]
MALTEKTVQEDLKWLIARYTGAANRVAQAYGQRRNPERDIHWLALQATKEYGAMVYHSGVMIRKAKAMAPLESIRKSSHDSFEEAEHYSGYMKILDWLLEGKSCEVPEMWGYGDISEAFGPGPGMKQSLWPEHYGYFEVGQRLAREARSEWIRNVILANREGAAVGFHYVMSKLPATDEYMRRLTEHERTVAEDELHHGSEVIPELARTLPSLADLEEAKQKVTDVHIQELRQRNEQFLHPMSAAEMKELEDDFRQNRIEPIPLFSMVAAG